MIPRIDPAPLAPSAAEGLALVPGLPFAPARIHELTGPARCTLALMLAARLTGPVVWIGPRLARPGQWHGLMPQGVARWIDPDRLLLAAAPKANERLWAMEEALRSRAAGLVVAELEAAPALTPVRRLLLAAEGGTAMGLILTPEGAVPGVESRWRMTPAHRPGHDAWQLDLLRARMVPPASWVGCSFWSDCGSAERGKPAHDNPAAAAHAGGAEGLEEDDAEGASSRTSHYIARLGPARPYQLAVEGFRMHPDARTAPAG